MDIQKTAAHSSIVLPLAAGTSVCVLTSLISNKIFKSPLQKALMHGGSAGVITTLATGAVTWRNPVDPPKTSTSKEEEKKAPEIALTLAYAKIYFSPEEIKNYLKSEDWTNFSLAIWAKHFNATPPCEPIAISLDDGQTFTLHTIPPVNEFIFTKEELLNFKKVFLDRYHPHYQQCKVGEKVGWVAAGDLPLVKGKKKEIQQQKILTHLKKIGINTDKYNIPSLIKEENWKDLSMAIFAEFMDVDLKAPQEQNIHIKEKTIVLYDGPPIHKVVFDPPKITEVSDYSKHFKKNYQEIDWEGKKWWISTNNLPLITEQN